MTLCPATAMVAPVTLRRTVLAATPSWFVIVVLSSKSTVPSSVIPSTLRTGTMPVTSAATPSGRKRNCAEATLTPMIGSVSVPPSPKLRSLTVTLRAFAPLGRVVSVISRSAFRRRSPSTRVTSSPATRKAWPASICRLSVAEPTRRVSSTAAPVLFTSSASPPSRETPSTPSETSPEMRPASPASVTTKSPVPLSRVRRPSARLMETLLKPTRTT